MIRNKRICLLCIYPSKSIYKNRYIKSWFLYIEDIKKNHLNAKTEFDENIVYILAIKQLFVKSTKLYYYCICTSIFSFCILTGYEKAILFHGHLRNKNNIYTYIYTYIHTYILIWKEAKKSLASNFH